MVSVSYPWAMALIPMPDEEDFPVKDLVNKRLSVYTVPTLGNLISTAILWGNTSIYK